MSKRDRRTVDPIKTINIFSTPVLERVHKLDYTHPKHRFDSIDWSRPADFVLRPPYSRPAQRIAEPLAPTYAETEARRSGDGISKPNLLLANRNVESIDSLAYLVRQQSRPLLVLGSAPLSEIPQNLATYKATLRVNATKKKSIDTIGSLVTPSKRSRETGFAESATKRRTGRSAVFETPSRGTHSADTSFGDADDSFSRVSTEQVLRMIDSGLVDTPEQSASPRVRSAAPGPSPKPTALVYAYTVTGGENSRVWKRQPNPWKVESMPPPNWRPR